MGWNMNLSHVRHIRKSHFVPRGRPAYARPWLEGLEGGEGKETVTPAASKPYRFCSLSISVGPVGLSLPWWEEQGFGSKAASWQPQKLETDHFFANENLRSQRWCHLVKVIQLVKPSSGQMAHHSVQAAGTEIRSLTAVGSEMGLVKEGSMEKTHGTAPAGQARAGETSHRILWDRKFQSFLMTSTMFIASSTYWWRNGD